MLNKGARLGPYEITGAIGAGGMGEVYRARDTRLGRDVAIKILPQHLSESPSATQRFEREARAISALQHQNICTLYDVGHQDGTDFLVMEYLEGETLAKRLEKGPLATPELVRIAIEIADGLARAHRKRILHRDLKPSNIMLTKSGAKLMDFGLAKAAREGAAPALESLTQSLNPSARPTPVTAQGTIVGTFQYMAPEQMEGKEADARSDIFSLGAVLYEMATGKRAFDGKTAASVIAAILEREPPAISSVQPMSPPALDRTVKICLAKDADERFQSAHDVKLQLEWIRDAGSHGNIPTHIGGRQFPQAVAWALAAIFFLAAAVLAAKLLWRAPESAQMTRSSLLPPEGLTFNSYSFEISPDGMRVAFVATDAQGKKMLWVRALSSAGAQQLRGTEGASYPFWAPDSRRIGCFAEGKLKAVDISNGAVRILAEARAGQGGTWNSDGVIVFAPDIYGPLYRVPDAGGSPTAVTEIPREQSGMGHRWPSFLPDGKHFLFFADRTTADYKRGIYVGSIDGQAAKLVSSEIEGNAVYASGDLLYTNDRSLMAQPFDAKRLEITGSAVAIAEQEIPADRAFGKSGFSVSRNGTLIFESFSDLSAALTWYDSTGKEIEGVKVPTFGFGEPRISPDGTLVAYDSDESRNGKSYIGVYNLKTGVLTTLTNGGNETDPAWSHDGKTITYVSGAHGHAGSIYEVPIDGSARPRLLLQSDKFNLIDWSLNGHLVFASFERGIPSVKVYSRADGQIVSLGVDGAEPRFSPDGKWIAYSGIFVQRFPGTGARIRVSSGDDAQPNWSHDGRHIFFVSEDKKMMEVDFDPQKGTVSVPRVAFQTRIVAPNYAGTQYDVAPDGRFLINSLSADRPSPLTLVANWPALAKNPQ